MTRATILNSHRDPKYSHLSDHAQKLIYTADILYNLWRSGEGGLIICAIYNDKIYIESNLAIMRVRSGVVLTTVDFVRAVKQNGMVRFDYTTKIETKEEHHCDFWLQFDISAVRGPLARVVDDPSSAPFLQCDMKGFNILEYICDNRSIEL